MGSWDWDTPCFSSRTMFWDWCLHLLEFEVFLIWICWCGAYHVFKLLWAIISSLDNFITDYLRRARKIKEDYFMCILWEMMWLWVDGNFLISEKLNHLSLSLSLMHTQTQACPHTLSACVHILCTNLLLLVGRMLRFYLCSWSFESTFRMPIIDKFKDMGTVLMGKVESGSIREGESLIVMPNKVKLPGFILILLKVYIGLDFDTSSLHLSFAGISESGRNINWWQQG